MTPAKLNEYSRAKSCRRRYSLGPQPGNAAGIVGGNPCGCPGLPHQTTWIGTPPNKSPNFAIAPLPTTIELMYHAISKPYPTPKILPALSRKSSHASRHHPELVEGPSMKNSVPSVVSVVITPSTSAHNPIRKCPQMSGFVRKIKNPAHPLPALVAHHPELVAHHPELVEGPSMKNSVVSVVITHSSPHIHANNPRFGNVRKCPVLSAKLKNPAHPLLPFHHPELVVNHPELVAHHPELVEGPLM